MGLLGLVSAIFLPQIQTDLRDMSRANGSQDIGGEGSAYTHVSPIHDIFPKTPISALICTLTTLVCLPNPQR